MSRCYILPFTRSPTCSWTFRWRDPVPCPNAQAFAEGLEGNSTLQKLVVTNNQLGVAGAQAA